MKIELTFDLNNVKHGSMIDVIVDNGLTKRCMTIDGDWSSDVTLMDFLGTIENDYINDVVYYFNNRQKRG